MGSGGPLREDILFRLASAESLLSISMMLIKLDSVKQRVEFFESVFSAGTEDDSLKAIRDFSAVDPTEVFEALGLTSYISLFEGSLSEAFLQSLTGGLSSSTHAMPSPLSSGCETIPSASMLLDGSSD